MSDIATLGITINSQPVTAATTALTGLAGAAKQAGPAVTALNAAAGPANAALGAMAVASAHASAAHAGFSTQAMAATHATRSMIEGFALGMPPMQIMMQQIAHLSYAASGPGGLSGAFKEAGSALLGAISPMVLLTGGLAAVTVGFGVALGEIAKTEMAFGELNERSGLTVQALHALASAAHSEGIGAPEFLKGMTHFNELTTEAQHSTGALAELFRANGQAIGGVQSNLSKVADLIHNAATEQDKYRLLQELGLPPTREWVQLLGQGGAALQEATAKASAFGGAVDENLIQSARKFEKQWNETWDNWINSGKRAVLSIYSAIGSLNENPIFRGVEYSRTPTQNQALQNYGQKLLQNDSFLTRRYSPYGYPVQQEAPVAAAGKTVVPADLQKQIALEQQRIGILGQTASVEQQVRSVELQIQAARLNGVNISAKEAQNLKDNARDRALGTEQIKSSVDSLHTEAGAFGMLSGDAAAYTAVQNRLNQAKRDGQVLTAQNIADIQREANVLGQATQHVDDMRLASDTLGLAFSTFHTQIQNGATTFNSFRLAGLAALNSLESKLIDIAAKNIVNSLFGNMSGGIFSSLFGGVHHGGSGPGDAVSMRAVSPAAFIGAPRFHDGVGPGEVPAIIRADESVLTPGQMRALGSAMGRGGGSVTIAPTINVGSAPGDDGQARKFAAMIADSVKRVALDTIRDQKRPGGILA